jgi:hypothetical protein
VDILDAGTANIPKYMRKDRMLQKAYDRVAASAASTGAEYLDRAYAMWAHNGGINGDTSIETFRKQFIGVSPDQMLNRALKLAGAQSVVDLDNGMRYNEYAAAKEQRLGASLAVETASRERVTRGLRALQNRYRNEQGGAGVANALGQLMEWAADPNAGVNILDKDAVARKLGVSTLSSDYEQAINVIYASSNDKNAGNAQFVAGEYAVTYNLARARQRDRREKERTRFLNELNSGAASDTKGLLMDLVKERLSTDQIKQLLAGRGFTDVETAEDIGAIVHAIDDVGGDGKEKSDLIRYALTAEGMGNHAFNAALTAYRNASTDQERKSAASDMRIARSIGNETLQAYYNLGGRDDDEKQRKAIRDVFNKGGEQAVKAKMENDLLRERLKESGINWKTVAGDDDVATIDELRNDLKDRRKKAVEAKDTGLVAEIDSITSKVNQVSSELYGGHAGTTDTMQIWTRLEPLLARLNTVLEGVGKVVADANSNKANGATPVETNSKDKQ